MKPERSKRPVVFCFVFLFSVCDVEFDCANGASRHHRSNKKQVVEFDRRRHCAPDQTNEIFDIGTLALLFIFFFILLNVPMSKVTSFACKSRS